MSTKMRNQNKEGGKRGIGMKKKDDHGLRATLFQCEKCCTIMDCATIAYNLAFWFRAIYAQF